MFPWASKLFNRCLVDTYESPNRILDQHLARVWPDSPTPKRKLRRFVASSSEAELGAIQHDFDHVSTPSATLQTGLTLSLFPSLSACSPLHAKCLRLCGGIPEATIPLQCHPYVDQWQHESGYSKSQNTSQTEHHAGVYEAADRLELGVALREYEDDGVESGTRSRTGRKNTKLLSEKQAKGLLSGGLGELTNRLQTQLKLGPLSKSQSLSDRRQRSKG
ncbi:unnamed protein product [Protopolystoma xenopodis]|uniref:Axin beta-catenin binding domain-containing protein n=1 Tax=Protopolystoma xenopodis TaxID=117903 RepID=A0A3S5BSW6_9PLAT|nr:unnamed protein product [Protopolystoma xenopodis]